MHQGCDGGGCGDGHSDDDDDDDDEELYSTTKSSKDHRSTTINACTESDQQLCLSNVMVIEGPCGSGKSSYVYECAAQLGYRVIEVNASEPRNGTVVKKKISEAAQSSHILTDANNTATKGCMGGSGGVGVGGGGGVGGRDRKGIASSSSSSQSGPLQQSECNLILFDEVRE